MSEYSHMLYISGYSATERYHYIKGALERTNTIDEEIAAGTRDSRYRTGEQIRKAKIEKGGLSASTWFLSREVSNTVTCQATPGSMLATMLSNSLSKSSTEGKRTIVLEEGGHPISLGLKKRDPFAKVRGI